MAKKKTVKLSKMIRIKKGAADVNGREYMPWVYKQAHPVVCVIGKNVHFGNSAGIVIGITDISNVENEVEDETE